MENELNQFLNNTNLSTAKTKVISDLEKVELNKVTAIVEETIKEGTPDEFKQIVCMYEGEKYRLPKSILADIKKLQEGYVLETISVMKSGSGMDTKYTLVPVDVKAKL